MERWKGLVYGDLDLSNKIAISNYGRIKNIQTGNVLKQNVGKTGYLTVVISLGRRGSYKAIKVHKAVAYMFVNGYKEGLVVNHIDGNKLNNTYTNLEWVTQKQNMRHAIDNNLCIIKCRKVRCIDTGVVFDSIVDAAEWCGVKDPKYITKCAKGEYFYSGKNPDTGERVTWEYV